MSVFANSAVHSTSSPNPCQSRSRTTYPEHDGLNSPIIVVRGAALEDVCLFWLISDVLLPPLAEHSAVPPTPILRVLRSQSLA